MNKFWTIVFEVYRKNVKSLGFIFMVISPIIFMVIFGVVGYFIAKDAAGERDVTIAVVEDSVSLSQQLVQEVESPHIILVDSIETAKKELIDDEIEGYLVISENDGYIRANFYHQTTNKNVDLSSINEYLSNVQLQNITMQLNLTEREIIEIQSAKIAVIDQELMIDGNGELQSAQNEEELDQQQFERYVKKGTAYAVSILTFMFIMNFSGIIAQEIASEKGTRIMEIILSSVSATTHFFGKVVGILLVTFTQIAVYSIMLVVLWNLPIVGEYINQYASGIDVSAIVGPVLAYGTLFFILGVIIYVGISAFLGSLVTRIEDVQKVMTPITLLGLVGFYVGIYAMSNANSPVVVVTSYIPFWTPFVMPFRMAADTVGNGQIMISLIILCISMVIITRVSIMFYRSNVLVYTNESMYKAFNRSLSILRNQHKKS